MKAQHAKAEAKFIKNFASGEKRESESAGYKVPGKILKDYTSREKKRKLKCSIQRPRQN